MHVPARGHGRRRCRHASAKAPLCRFLAINLGYWDILQGLPDTLFHYPDAETAANNVITQCGVFHMLKRDQRGYALRNLAGFWNRTEQKMVPSCWTNLMNLFSCKRF